MHYINNKEFAAALTEHRKNWLASQEQGTPAPVVPDAIASQFLLLAKKLSTRFNFSGYSWKDDMISDAVISCLRSAHKFNSEVSPNAFGFFNILCWRAFVDVIKIEKEHSYIKAKMFYAIPEDSFDVQDQDVDDFSFVQEFIPYFDVQDFEKKDQERRIKNKKKRLDAKEGLEALLDLNPETGQPENNV
jgi:hypothetical protein